MRPQAAWNVITHAARAGGPTRSVSRSRISPAALFVKVIARISGGFAPTALSKCAMRRVSTRVFPEPAPAITSTGPSVVSTASRCAGLRSWRYVSGVVAAIGSTVSRLPGDARWTRPRTADGHVRRGGGADPRPPGRGRPFVLGRRRLGRGCARPRSGTGARRPRSRREARRGARGRARAGRAPGAGPELAGLGYERAGGAPPMSFESVDVEGRQVDVHPIADDGAYRM